MSENPDNAGEARPGPAEEAEQPIAPAPRRAPSLPVRFEDPVVQQSDRVPEIRPVLYQSPRPVAQPFDERRPVLYQDPRRVVYDSDRGVYERERILPPRGTGRYQSYYEDVNEVVEGRSSSSFLGESERERESPAPIDGNERGEDGEDFGRGIRSGRRSDDDAGMRNRVRGWSGDADPIILRNRVVESFDDDDREARLRQSRQSSYEARRPRDRPYVSTSYDTSDYQPRRKSKSRERRGSYYDEDEIDIRVPPRRRSRERERRVTTGSDYYDDDELDIRVRRGRDPTFPVRYPEPPRRSRERERRVTIDSDYYDDDELDIRVRGGVIRQSQSAPEHHYRPAPRPYYQSQSNSYLVPAISSSRSRARPAPPPSAPIIINNRIYNDYDDDDYLVRTPPRSRSLSRPHRRYISPPGPPHRYRSPSPSRRHRSPTLPAEPIIINNRVYNDYEDAPTLSHHRSRSRPSAFTPAPVILNTHAYSSDEDENYLALSRRHRSPEVDLDAITQAYSFSLSRHTKNSNGTRSISGSISEISEKSEPQEEEPLKKPSNSGRTHNILRSQYVGDGLIGGRHVVQLTVTPESDPSTRKRVSPIFRWVHFEDMTMDLEQFQSNALSIPGLTEAERNAISKLLGRAKKKHDKPLQTSRNMKTKFMVPSFLQDNISGEMRPKASRARTISWLCEPYFCLDKYGTPSNLRPSSHPMRTLLQARYSLVQKKRDMEQAVCHLPDTPAEHCFYIAQIWFLILDDSLVVSCAQSPISSLQGESISIIQNPATESATTLSQNILIYSKNSLVWSLPVDECQDWFAFVSHFWEYWPRPFQITHHEKVITAEDWQKLFVIAKKSGIRLSIEFRSNIKEPAKGILLQDPISEEDPNKDAAGPTFSPNTPDPQTSSTPSLRVKDHRRSKPDVSGDGVKDEFHVFSWISVRDGSRNTSPAPPTVNLNQVPPNVEGQELDEDLKEIDDFLCLKTNLNDRLTYRACPLSQRIAVYKLLATERNELTTGNDTDIANQDRRKRYETKVDILNAAELILQFFLPPNSQSITAQKYWGALYRLLGTAAVPPPLDRNPFAPPPVSDYYPNKTDRDCIDLDDWLKLINRSITPFRDLISEVPTSDRSSIQIPEELPRAWLHLLLSLAFLAKDMQVFDEQMVICNDLIALGMRKVIRNVSDVRLSKYTVFPPSEFASLVTFQLLQDVKGSTLDISEVYLEYLKSLESQIESNPLDRSHQDRIVSLKQEISVISETLAQQQKILNQAQVGFGLSRIVTQGDLEPQPYEAVGHSRSRPSPHYNAHRSPAYIYVDNDPLPRPVQPSPGEDLGGPAIDPSGVQGLLLQDGLSVVEKRIREFREMRDRASDLGDWNIQKIDSNKDRQEAAIYAFTIVTIIFLPLSTVASILGMNTFDVRNMTVNQWVFWATALPLMVLIITLCLIWAGELKNFWEGFSKLWRKKGNSGYVVIDDQFGRRERDRYFDTPVRSRSREPLKRRHTLYGGARESYV